MCLLKTKYILQLFKLMMNKFRFQLKEDTQCNFLKYKLAKIFAKPLFWKTETGLLSIDANMEQERGTGKLTFFSFFYDEPIANN